MNLMNGTINKELFGSFQTRRRQFVKKHEVVKIQETPNPLPKKNIDTVKNTKLKFNIPAFVMSIAGTLGSMALIRKYQGKAVKINKPSAKPLLEKGLNVLENHLKNNTTLLHTKKTLEYTKKALEYTKKALNIFDYKTNVKEMILLAGGAIAGGLAGGILSDYGRNIKEKVKESVFCFNNIAITTLAVTGTKKAVESSKYGKNIWAKIGGVVVGIVAGMPLSAYVSNKINNNIIDKNGTKERKLKLQDGLVHVDDIIESMAIYEVPFVAKLLPFMYAAYGYQAGNK